MTSDHSSPTAWVATRGQGEERARTILAQPDMLDVDTFAERQGLARAQVQQQRLRGAVLALHGADGRYRFPAWQLDGQDRPYRGLVALARVFQDTWSVYRFLLQAHPELDGLTGLDALRRGQDARLIGVAETVAAGDFS